jgi:RNAse (barnase) inhibitor barstar
MEKESQRRISDLIDLIKNHRGTELEIEWKSLRRVYNAHVRNAADLVELVELPHDELEIALHILRVDQSPVVMDEYFDEVYRLLLNYTSSVSALRDAARNLMRDYPTGPFRFEYDNRIAQLGALEAAHFIQDLRNYLQHKRVPPLQIEFSMTGEEDVSTDFSVRLDPQKLLKWKSWSRLSKSYIRAKETVVLTDSVKEYVEANTELYRWLFSQFSSVHRNEIQEIESLKFELRALLGIQDDVGTA